MEVVVVVLTRAAHGAYRLVRLQVDTLTALARLLRSRHVGSNGEETWD